MLGSLYGSIEIKSQATAQARATTTARSQAQSCEDQALARVQLNLSM